MLFLTNLTQEKRLNKIVFMFPILSGIMFGAAGVFVRTLTGFGFNNGTIIFARVFFAMIIMFLLILFQDKKLLKINIKDLPIFIGTGIIGMLGVNLFYNEAIDNLTLAVSAVLLSTAPVIVVLLAAIIFKEKITLRKIVCMTLAIGGCVLATGMLEESVIVSFYGLVVGIGSALFYALYSIFSRMASNKHYDTYTIIFYSVVLITIVMLPFANIGTIIDFATVSPVKNVFFLFFHSTCATVLPYVFLTLGVKHMEAGTASILASGTEPVAAVFFGMLFYMEVPIVLMIVGLIVTIVALAFLCKSDK